jgi:ribosome biogenesis protein Nip4
MKFRALSEDEREIVRKASKDYGLNIDTALKGKKLITVAAGRREVFATNRQTVKILEKMGRDPYCAGLYIGEIRGKKFKLDLEGAYLIASLAGKKVVVSEEAEQLVLYGRDVFSKSVVSAGDLRKGDKCIIVNRFGDALALGRVVGGQIFVENIKDRGWYLRRGR